MFTVVLQLYLVAIPLWLMSLNFDTNLYSKSCLKITISETRFLLWLLSSLYLSERHEHNRPYASLNHLF